MVTENIESVAEIVTHEVEHYNGFLSLYDTNTWVLFSFLIFSFVLWKFTKDLLCKALDNRSNKIKEALDEALQLRTEAENLLQEYKEKQKNAETEAKKIIEDAKEYARNLMEHAEIQAARQAEKREKIIQGKIQKAQDEALKEINARIVDLAAKASQIVMEQNFKNDKEFIDTAIEKFPNKINK